MTNQNKSLTIILIDPSICLKHVKRVWELLQRNWLYTGRNSSTVVPVEMVKSLLVGGCLYVLLILDQLLLVLKLYHLSHLLPFLDDDTFDMVIVQSWEKLPWVEVETCCLIPPVSGVGLSAGTTVSPGGSWDAMRQPHSQAKTHLPSYNKREIWECCDFTNCHEET